MVAQTAVAFGSMERMATRYVSSTGNDDNPGTLSAPWQTITRVNEAISDHSLVRGDSVLLKRGDTFFGFLTTGPLTGAGVLTFGAYGWGTPPVLSGYKTSLNVWAPDATYPGVWKLDIRKGSGQYTGNVLSDAVDVAFLRVGTEIKGFKRFAIAQLANEWDFYSDATYVYVKRSASPGAGVRIAVRQSGVRLGTGTAIDGLNIIGHGAHGVKISAATPLSQVTVTRCIIEEIGGAELTGKPGTRYGNGIEVWVGSSDVTVQNNLIRSVYDTATTIQGETTSALTKFTRVNFTGNRIETSCQSFEVWCRPEQATEPIAPDSGFFACGFTSNICINAGDSWSYAPRPDKGKGAHLLVYALRVSNVDITISGNAFYGATDNLIHNVNDVDLAGYRTSDNLVALHSSRLIASNRPETVQQWEAYVAATSQQVRSDFHILPTSSANADDRLTSLEAETALARLEASVPLQPRMFPVGDEH